jgi:hypothetical protein
VDVSYNNLMSFYFYSYTRNIRYGKLTFTLKEKIKNDTLYPTLSTSPYGPPLGGAASGAATTRPRCERQ